MLNKMGWSAGKGLGVKEDGENSLIKIKVKSNNLGNANLRARVVHNNFIAIE